MEIDLSVRRVKATICAIDVLLTRMRFMTLVIISGQYKHVSVKSWTRYQKRMDSLR